MPLAPFRDRTIRLTLESDLQGQTDVVQLQATKSFTDRFMPTSGLGGYVAAPPANGSSTAAKTLTLRGPMSISIKHVAGVAEENGLSTSFLQPWYIESIPITIKGQSYIGTYPLLSVSDRDVERALKMFRQSLNDFATLNGKPGSKERIFLDLQGNPPGARRFLGFIRGLDWDEDVKSVNVLNYTIEFIGRNVDNAALAKGKLGAQQASAVSRGLPNGN